MRHAWILFIVFVLLFQSSAGIGLTADQERNSKKVKTSDPQSGQGGRRVALVIGNGSYAEVPLSNPVNDATGVAGVFRSLGFDVVTGTNQKKVDMKRLIREFGDRLAIGEGNVGVFYFAGHGLQANGENFMVPIGATSPTNDAEAEDEGVNLELVLAQMERSQKGLNIVILDACRNNPFRGWRSASNGLAFVNAPTGTLIAYATSPGRTAADGRGSNSPYTTALLRHLGKPDVSLMRMFELVRTDVLQETRNNQTPWESTSVTNGSEFYLAGRSVVTPSVAGPTVVENRDRLPMVRTAFTRGVWKNGAVVKTTVAAQDGCEVYTEDLGNGVKLEMVKIPGGAFEMGSPDSEAGRDRDEGPVHRVTVRDFLMGRFEVTQRIWKLVAELPKIGVELNPDPSRFKGDNLPVENVSWDEVREFIERLNQKLGLEGSKGYRLPSEAEWEYAARARMTTPFGFGETIGSDIVNYGGAYPPYGRGVKGVDRQKTIEVGSLRVANGFGLYDMHGNVWEWCEDEWHDNYEGAPVDGRAWISSAGAALRVIRGGSWYNFAVYCRSAFRLRNAPGSRSNGVGFRLSRTLP